MGKRMTALALLVCLAAAALITTPASAVSYSERGKYYIYILSRSVTYYTYQSVDIAGDTAEDLSFKYAYTAAGTLPAGTPVGSDGFTEGMYMHISYMYADDAVAHVAVDKSAVKSNYVVLDVGIGYKIKVPIPATASAQDLFNYVSWRYGVDPKLSDCMAALRSGRGGGGGGGSSATPAPVIVTESYFSLRNEDGIRMLVDLEVLGLRTSTIRKTSNGEAVTVSTRELVWETNAEAARRVGWLVASNGRVYLHPNSNPNSRVSLVCEAGRIVPVFDVGEKMTGIIYDGQAGYVLNSAIAFPGEEIPEQTAVITYRGSRTNTDQKVNLRVSGSGKARRLTLLTPGTPATVLHQGDSWSEIDCDGWHGYVMNDFLTLTNAPEQTNTAITSADAN